MVATNEVLDALKSIGLNLYERKIFVALLAKGIATAAEVSEIANVPRSRSYDILESLAEKGFVVFQPSKPIKYVALPPQEALERTKHNIKKKYEEMAERIEKLKTSPVMAELEKIHKQGLSLVSPSDMTGTLKGKHIIDRQLQSLFKSAKKSIDIMTTAQGLTNLYSTHFRVLKKLGKKGIKLRIAAPVNDKEIAKALLQIAELRHIKNPVGRIIKIDDEHVFVALTDDQEVHETQDMVFWANSPHVASSVISPLFDQVWNSGKNIAD
ncbi:MAG: hypothetical protein DRP13_00265 [Candidatus Aenigmatarchaeota archaeon]|nr:MAG: hypothetical protein DRP13_00265 [Candidatus Aenigmarchaeota archaeon]